MYHVPSTKIIVCNGILNWNSSSSKGGPSSLQIYFQDNSEVRVKSTVLLGIPILYTEEIQSIKGQMIKTKVLEPSNSITTFSPTTSTSLSTIPYLPPKQD